KDTNTLTKADTTIPAKSLTSNAYYYEATSELIGAKNREILLGKETEKTYYNWVASRSVYVGSGHAYWCMDCVLGGYVYARSGFCNSGGGEYGVSICLRPVVSLPSNVTIDDVKKKAGTITETWNDPLGLY
ncbi:MAG: hypothetical protein ACI4UX_05055, partial [Clostridia bacterium]